MHCEGYATTYVFSFLHNSSRQLSKRLLTTMEWARFRKYARRMRELREYATLDSPSRKILSVIQFCTINEPLFPNLKALHLWGIGEIFIPFIPLFLSPRTTYIDLRFKGELPKAKVASMVATLPTLCPNLQAIEIKIPPSDPMITATVSRMVLNTNRNALQRLSVDCPLTEEAGGVIYKLPNLRSLSVAVERGVPLLPASLPNLTDLRIACEDENDWPRLFHGATLGKLENVTFYPRSGHIGDFLGIFEKAAISSSVQNTLSKFRLSAPSLRNPNYSSLLPFTQMVHLEIRFSCDYECSSGVDDDIVISLSQAMPKLESLVLGDEPCDQITGGVTTKGLLALAHHCPKLSFLCVHLRVASLSELPGIPEVVLNAGPAASWKDCAFMVLEVGETPMPEGSALITALTLLRIFPRLYSIVATDEGWKEVKDAIDRSGEIVGCLSKQHPFTTP